MLPPKPELSEFKDLSNRDLLVKYNDGFNRINPIIKDFTVLQLNKKFLPYLDAGEWSCIEVLGHIADAEIAFSHRMRRIAAEDRPLFIVWQETDFINNGLYDLLSIIDILALIKAHRQFMSGWLATLPDQVFSRVGINSKQGEQTLRKVLERCTWHLQHHAWYLDRKIEVGS